MLLPHSEGLIYTGGSVRQEKEGQNNTICKRETEGSAESLPPRIRGDIADQSTLHIFDSHV